MVHQILFGSETRPLKTANLEIPCFILDTQDRVCSLAGIQKALGYDGKSENWLADLLLQIQRFIPNQDLIDSLQNAPVFENPTGTQKNIGISPMLCTAICENIVLAKKEGFLKLNQLKYAKLAEIFAEQLPTAHLYWKIDEATGFLFFKENATERFSQLMATMLGDPAFHWTRTLPDAFYHKIFELNRYDWADLQNNPKPVGKILFDVVFSRLPNDLIEALRLNGPKRNYHRKNHLPQDNQHPRLREYVSNVLALIKAAADNWNIFLQLLNRSYPKNTAFTTKFPAVSPTAAKAEPLSGFNQVLKVMS